MYNIYMIKDIKIYNRFNMEKFARTDGLDFPYKNRPWYLISIHSGDVLASSIVDKIFKQMGCMDILSIEFWDVTLRELALLKIDHPSAVVFDKSHARNVIDFITKANQPPEDSSLIVHCHAGISRSGAIGTFACDFLGLDYVEFIKNNSNIFANSHVLRTLREEAGMVPVFKAHGGITLPGEETMRKYRKLCRRRRSEKNRR